MNAALEDYGRGYGLAIAKLAKLRTLRGRVTCNTTMLSVLLSTVSIGSSGRVEQRLEVAAGETEKLRSGLYRMAALLQSTKERRGSILKNYTDDEAFSKEFEKELMEIVLSSSIMRRELRQRGLLDDKDPYNIEKLL